MKALVLSGGGAPGAYEAGVICGLARAGETFDLVSGTSIGALNGVLYAQGDLAVLERIWRTIVARRPLVPLPVVARALDLVAAASRIGHEGVPATVVDLVRAAGDAFALSPPSRLLSLTGALDPEPVATLLRQELHFERLHTLARGRGDERQPYVLRRLLPFCRAERRGARGGTAELWRAHPLDASIYAEAIRASAAVPGAFAPVEVPVDGETDAFVDGGVANDTPLGLAIDAGARDLTIVLLDPAVRPEYADARRQSR